MYLKGTYLFPPYISTLSTRIPHGSVASSSTSCKCAMCKVQCGQGDHQAHLHANRDAVPLTQDLVEVPGAQNIPQGSLG